MAVIIVREGAVFVARRPPGGDLGGMWEFPGGKLEPGESDSDAAVREFMEEFGAEIESIGLLGEGSFRHRGSDRALAAWLARLSESAVLVPAEHREMRWATSSELDALDLAESDRSILRFVKPLLRG